MNNSILEENLFEKLTFIWLNMDKKNEIWNADFFDYQLFSIQEGTESLKNAQGKGEKHLLVLLKTEDDLPELQTLLTNILKAASFELTKDALLLKVTVQDGISLAAIYQEQEIQHILVFGLSPQNVGLNWTLPPYTPYVFDGKNYLFADELATLNTNKALKGKLWNCLKTLFLD